MALGLQQAREPRVVEEDDRVPRVEAQELHPMYKLVKVTRSHTAS
jgi:hypothetical protein